MAKKIIVSIFALIVLCLCCSVSFAEENGNSITLGNEVMKSIDKTQNSFSNVMTANTMEKPAGSIMNGVNNVMNGLNEGMNNYQNNNEGNQNSNNYNSTLTTTEGTTGNNMGMNTMTTTTWMWIILAVAAIIMIVAIWYYASQSND